MLAVIKWWEETPGSVKCMIESARSYKVVGRNTRECEVYVFRQVVSVVVSESGPKEDNKYIVNMTVS